MHLNEEEWQHFKSLGLLTAKPVLYCCNVSELEAAEGNELSRAVQQRIHATEPEVAGAGQLLVVSFLTSC